MLFRYHASLDAALKALYPDYPWDSSKFVVPISRSTKSYDKDYLLKALDTAVRALGIKEVQILII